jgi:hypothetical protein
MEYMTPDETINQILERYTVTDLIEQTDEDLERGDELFYKAETPIEILAQGTEGLIDWWKVMSGSKFYEVRRFRNFCWCSCKSFFFSKKMCKHLALTTGVYCQQCREMRAKHGKLCHSCFYTQNGFLKSK